MDLVLTDDQRMIRDEALRLLAADDMPHSMRHVADSESGFDDALWAKVARDLGWCAIGVPQDFGGLGLGHTELVLLMEAAGRKLTAIPLWSTACAAAPLLLAVAREDAKAALLPRIASGDIAFAVAWPAPGACDVLSAPDVTATPDVGGYRLSGCVEHVIDLPGAGLVLAPASFDGRCALFVIERSACRIQRHETLDATRPAAKLMLDDLLLPESSRLDADGFSREAAEPAIATACLCLAAEEIGAARGAMDLTLAYISGRVQFGRTIASFQAIKHRCALLEVELAEARALVYGAAANFHADNRSLEIAAARALASQIAFRAAEECVQLHGGVGFTWEYHAHLYLKRAQAAGAMLGLAHAHLARIANALFVGGPRA